MQRRLKTKARKNVVLLSVCLKVAHVNVYEKLIEFGAL